MVKGMFCIAGRCVQAEKTPTTNWEPFVSKANREADIRIKQMESAFPTAHAALLSQHDELIVRAFPGGGWLFESPTKLAPAQVLLCADRANIAFHLPPVRDTQAQQLKLNHLLRTAFECRFCYDGVVSLHAACVETDGQAVAFTGHSGLGKSTRAGAWVDALGAKWISGDRPAVRLEKQGAAACGVPWDGKEQIFRDVERPLRCILEVRRSPENYVRRLTKDQARQLIMQQSFVPMWDTDAAVMAMANVRRLVGQGPVYRVFCGPDAEDARAIYDTLFHHPERIREEAKDMKIKAGFVLRSVVDEFIVMPTGDNIAKFEGAVVLNDVGAFIFKQLENAVSHEDVLSAVLNEYEVDEAKAAADLDALLKQFETMGILEK